MSSKHPDIATYGKILEVEQLFLQKAQEANAITLQDQINSIQQKAYGVTAKTKHDVAPIAQDLTETTTTSMISNNEKYIIIGVVGIVGLLFWLL